MNRKVDLELEMKCPQCNSIMDSEGSLTPSGSIGDCLKTRHYRCEECDTEYVKAGRAFNKIDGAEVALDQVSLKPVTE